MSALLGASTVAAQLDAMFIEKLEDLSYTMPNVQLESVGTFPGV